MEEEQKQIIVTALKNDNTVKEIFEKQIAEENLGVVRRADYLNLYQRIYGNNTDQISDLEAGLFTALNEAFTQNSDNLAAQEMLAEIVWKNQLGKNISTDSNPDPVQQFVQAFQPSEGSNNVLALEKQALLVQTSAGRAGDSNKYVNIVKQIYDTDNGYNEAAWFIKDLLRANADFPFKEQVISAYNTKLNERISPPPQTSIDISMR